MKTRRSLIADALVVCLSVAFAVVLIVTSKVQTKKADQPEPKPILHEKPAPYGCMCGSGDIAAPESLK